MCKKKVSKSGNSSANLKVSTPQEVQWKLPLRQAAITHEEQK